MLWKNQRILVTKKYEISETNARNIFVNRRTNITLLQMRKKANDVNPEEFFIPADECAVKWQKNRKVFPMFLFWIHQ